MSAVQPNSVPEVGVSPVDIGAAQPRGGPTVLRMLLGIQLRRLREAANLTPDQAGYEIRASRSKISRVEHGRVGFKERDVSDLLSLYGVTDPRERDRMLALAQQANNQGWWAKYDDIMPDWFESYVGLEQATSLIRTFELQFVPGLFQTEDYARGVTMLGHRSAPSDEIEHRVSLRMQRQKILHLDDSPRIWAVIDESALRRPMGGVEAITRLRELGHPARVLILTTYDTDRDVLPALEAGATGYLLKDAPRDELIRPVRAAHQGQSVLAPTVASTLVGLVGSPGGRRSLHPAGGASGLVDRR